MAATIINAIGIPTMRPTEEEPLSVLRSWLMKGGT